jgi:hypothetical protein
MTTAEILRTARDLISDPEKWIKGADALPSRDADPETDEVDPLDDRALCFCVGGAISRAAGGDSDEAYEAARAFAQAADNSSYPFTFNDRESTTHADVLAALDKAIEASS